MVNLVLNFKKLKSINLIVGNSQLVTCAFIRTLLRGSPNLAFVVALSIFGITLMGSPAAAEAGATATAGQAQDEADMALVDNRVFKLNDYVTSLNKQIGHGIPEVVTHSNECSNAAKLAAKSCLESFSPAIQEVIPALSVIGSAISVVTGVKEKCEKANQGYELLQGAFAAYQALCGGMQLSCKSKCTKAKKANEAAIAKIKATDPVPDLKPSVDDMTKASAHYDQVLNGCASYQKQLAGAVLGSAQMINSIAASKDCADQTAASGESECVKNPNLPQCVNCTKAEYQQHPSCICAHNPRAAGCGQAQNESITLPGQQGASNSTDQADSGGASTFGLGGSDSGNLGGSDSSSMAPGGGGGMAGAGGGMGAGGVGSGAKGTDGTASGAKGLSADVLSGDSGGGGGGSRSSGSSFSDNPYNRFLPSSSATDPNAKGSDRSPASIRDQITGSNGLSNFEKVKRRYFENKSTFLSR